MIKWSNIFRGMAMGICDLVPGVSGGTVALVLGIYHQLIAAINGILSRDWKKTSRIFNSCRCGYNHIYICL